MHADKARAHAELSASSQSATPLPAVRRGAAPPSPGCALPGLLFGLFSSLGHDGVALLGGSSHAAEVRGTHTTLTAGQMGESCRSLPLP